MKTTILLESIEYEAQTPTRSFYDVIKRDGLLKMKVDNNLLEQLANDPDRIDKMNAAERKEILEFLRTDADRRKEEERNGNGLFDQIKRYTDTLSEEDRKRFYLDLSKRWARIAKEELKRLNKIWKTKKNSMRVRNG
jgi:hypothetical protein